MTILTLLNHCRRTALSSLKGISLSKVFVRGAIVKRSPRNTNLPIITAKNPYPKDIILYINRNKTTFFTVVGVTSVMQLFAWGNWATLALFHARETSSADSPPLSIRYRIMIASLYMTAGLFVMSAGWFYCLRNVQKIILRKGGTSAIICTYTPWGKTRNYLFKLQELTCNSGREVGKGKYIAIASNQHKLNFLVNSSGEIHNPKLFDATVGRKRNLKFAKELGRDQLF